MAAASVATILHQFNCSVCLNLLKNPVTIACGHSYCEICISGHWDQEDANQGNVYSCPQCKLTFSTRPALSRNVILSEVIEELRKTHLQSAAGQECDVECDVCTGGRHKAVKSCLQCLTSFCEIHLQPHYGSSAFKKHKLIKASNQLQEKICSTHNKLLEIYCRTDQKCICYLCTVDEHKDHENVSVAAQRVEKQKELQKTQQSSQQKIQAKEKNLTDFKQAMESLTNSEQVVMEDTEKVFEELVRMVIERCSEVKEVVRTQKKAELSQARTLSDNLHQEIAELRKKDSELEQLSQIEDHLDFLQTSLSSSVSSDLEDVPEIGINPQASFEKVQPCLAELKKSMEGLLTKELKNISDIIKREHIVHVAPKEVPTTRESLLRYASHFILDSSTIQGQVCLVNMGRGISSNFVESSSFAFGRPSVFGQLANQGYKNYGHVLGAQKLSGHSYWEAEWSESNAEVIMAVTYTGSGRLGEDLMSWALLCSHSGYSFQHNNVKTQLINLPPGTSFLGATNIYTKVGIYLDFDAGILAFYSVSDSIYLLHKVQTSFTQAVCPAFAVRGTGSGTCTLSLPVSIAFGSFESFGKIPV